MFLIEFFNNRIKRFNIFDIKLVQAAAIFFVLAIVKLFPEIMEINIWCFIVLAVICAIRPMYLMFIKR